MTWDSDIDLKVHVREGGLLGLCRSKKFPVPTLIYMIVLVLWAMTFKRCSLAVHSSFFFEEDGYRLPEI